MNPNVNVPESLANVAPVILAEALDIWRAQTPLISAGVVTDYSGEFAEKGEAVDIPDVQPMEAFDIEPDPNNVPESEKPQVDNRRIVLDKWKGSSFNLTQAEYAAIEQGKVLPSAVTRAAEALVKQVNESVWEAYVQASHVIGQPNTALFANDSKSLLQARKYLNTIHAPQTDRFLVVDVDTETDMVELVENQNGALSLQNPFALGQRLGFNVYYDVYNPMHEAGSASENSDLIVDAVETVNVSTQYLGLNLKGNVKQYYLNIGEAEAGDTIRKGDILQIAGVPGYVNALENAEAEGGTIRVLIDRYVDAEEAAAVTVYPDHVISLAGHRSAIGLAVRNLDQGNSIPDKGITTTPA